MATPQTVAPTIRIVLDAVTTKMGVQHVSTHRTEIIALYPPAFTPHRPPHSRAKARTHHQTDEPVGPRRTAQALRVPGHFRDGQSLVPRSRPASSFRHRYRHAPL